MRIGGRRIDEPLALLRKFAPAAAHPVRRRASLFDVLPPERLVQERIFLR
jgi:hypothetical protein